MTPDPRAEVEALRARVAEFEAREEVFRDEITRLRRRLGALASDANEALDRFTEHAMAEKGLKP